MVEYVPSLGWRFNLAFQFASGLHHQQMRKGSSVPYIAHLMGVCSLVLDAGGDEDQAIVALLHDAVEDQGGVSTLATIRHLFGDRVANAVEACSDSTVSDPQQKPPWRERKEKYLAQIQNGSADSLMVGIADKLHNARAILRDCRQIGDRTWEKFSVPKEQQLWYYRALAQAFSKTAAPRVLVDEFARVVEELAQNCGICGQ